MSRPRQRVVDGVNRCRTSRFLGTNIGLAGVLGLLGRDEIRGAHDRTGRGQVAASFDRVGVR